MIILKAWLKELSFFPKCLDWTHSLPTFFVSIYNLYKPHVKHTLSTVLQDLFLIDLLPHVLIKPWDSPFLFYSRKQMSMYFHGTHLFIFSSVIHQK